MAIMKIQICPISKQTNTERATLAMLHVDSIIMLACTRMYAPNHIQSEQDERKDISQRELLPLNAVKDDGTWKQAE